MSQHPVDSEFEAAERGSTPGSPRDASAVPEPRPAPVGRLVCVMGAKGGCGVTTVAANVAGSLAGVQRVCLLDLDLCKGDVAGFLDMNDNRSVSLLLEQLGHLDQHLVEGAAEVHRTGLHVLAQPYDLADLHQVDAEEVRQLLTVVRRSYDLVVVDAGSRVDVSALCTALEADDVLLVATPDVPALRDAQRVLRLLTRLEVPTERIRLVVNKRAATGGVSDAEIEQHLQVPVSAAVARDDEVCTRAGATGRLVIEQAPQSRTGRDLAELWPRVNGVEVRQAPPRMRWLWGAR